MKKTIICNSILILLLLPIMQVHAFTGNLDGRVNLRTEFHVEERRSFGWRWLFFGGEATIEENASVKGNVRTATVVNIFPATDVFSPMVIKPK